MTCFRHVDEFFGPEYLFVVEVWEGKSLGVFHSESIDLDLIAE
tara:strand:+ start:458 stop:586 length:129 start_codon:yes stop_codon:yes gene_type:complete